MSSESSSKKIAILFRYGASEHVDFLPALPNIVHGLSARGWEVHHFGFKGQGTLPESLQTVLRIHSGPWRVSRGNKLDKWVKMILWMAWLPFLGRKLQQSGVERVFVDETLPLSGWLLRMGYKGWLSFTIHDFFTEIYIMPHAVLRPLGRSIHRIDHRTWKNMDHVFTRVVAAKNALVEEGISSKSISAVPDAVNLEVFSPSQNPEELKRVRKTWGIAEDDLVMVHHGILHPNKGNAKLVHALFRLRHKIPNLKLLIIGDGPERLEIERTAHTRGIADRVILTGWLPGMIEIAALLKASDIGLVMRKGIPGDQFHVTSTLVHNLACGLPTVAVNLAGIAEVLAESGAGFLINRSCGEDFDQHVLDLARYTSMRRRMGAHARRLAEYRFDPAKVAEAYIDPLSS